MINRIVVALIVVMFVSQYSPGSSGRAYLSGSCVDFSAFPSGKSSSSTLELFGVRIQSNRSLDFSGEGLHIPPDGLDVRVLENASEIALKVGVGNQALRVVAEDTNGDTVESREIPSSPEPIDVRIEQPGVDYLRFRGGQESRLVEICLSVRESQDFR